MKELLKKINSKEITKVYYIIKMEILNDFLNDKYEGKGKYIWENS